jgi:ABC-type spermidine/putrescine transport system permease subunit II
MRPPACLGKHRLGWWRPRFEAWLALWIFGAIRLGQQLPKVNVVVFLVLVLTFVPVYLAQRLTRESGILPGR